MSLTGGSSSFAKRNQHILGAKILNLIEKYPEGPPASAILELQKNTLGNGDVTNFHNVQPRTKSKGRGPRSKKSSSRPKPAAVNKSRKSASTAKTPVAVNPSILKSTSLTSNHSTYSSKSNKSRPSSAPKSRSSNSKTPIKTTSAKSPSGAASQKPKPSSSSGSNQRRPSTATGDFAGTQSKSNTNSSDKPSTVAQRMKNVKSAQVAPRKKTVISDTRVVLAPRFGPESTESSVLNVGQPRHNTAPPGHLWRKESPPTINSAFRAEKSKWVQQAVYKIGESLWSASGLVPPKKVIDSPIIQDNFGELYDLAVKSKFQQGFSSDHEEPLRKISSDARTFSDEQSTYSRSSVGTQLSFVSTTEGPPTSYVPEKEQQASNLLLKNFRAKLVKQNITSRMKDAATFTQPDLNNNIDTSENETKLVDGIKLGKMNESAGDKEEDVPKLTHNCYISEGKIIPEDEPNKFTVSSFAPLSSSLRRVRPSLNNTYFRRTVDLKGFEVHELRFKYSSSRIFVEGKQAQKGDKNARLVREIIALPPELTIDNLKVMRGKKGVVVFEEIIKSQ